MNNINTFKLPIFIIVIAAIAVSPLLVLAATDEERANEIADIVAEAQVLTNDPTLDDLAGMYGITRDANKESEVGHAGLVQLYEEHRFTWEGIVNQEEAYDGMVFFITYDFGTTAHLGSGERLGVLNSWRSSQRARSEGLFVPRLEGHWMDILKIANGRWPEVVRNDLYEEDVAAIFREVYLRDPDRLNPHDDAAVMTIAYGLRPEPRNLSSEAQAIGFFKGIYQRDPSSAQDWDIVRAIAYSGATR